MSFLTNAGSTWPRDPHHRIFQLSLQPQGRPLRGAWVGGPVAASVFEAQGITLAEPDEYAAFQSTAAVYHDDVNDYTTNEPSVALNAAGLLAMATLATPGEPPGCSLPPEQCSYLYLPVAKTNLG